jgi:uncharacterized protein
MTERPTPSAQLAIDLVATYGDPDAMADALAEDAQWWISPSTPAEIMDSLSTGRETVRGNMQRVFSLIYKPGTVSTTVHHAIGVGDLAAVRFTMHARLPNGASYENEYTDWIETKGGQIVRVWEYVDAAWAAAVMAAGGVDVSASMGTSGS